MRFLADENFPRGAVEGLRAVDSVVDEKRVRMRRLGTR
jgi:hypothetical protein